MRIIPRFFGLNYSLEGLCREFAVEALNHPETAKDFDKDINLPVVIWKHCVSPY